MSFGVGREDWAVIVMTGEFRENGLPLWSVAYGEDPELPGTKEEVVGRARERLKRCTKGAGDFEIVRAEPYLMHQRVAAQVRKGRVLLAGGALHVSCLPLFRCQGNLGLILSYSNNPIGGLGLTGGILYAYCYGNALCVSCPTANTIPCSPNVRIQGERHGSNRRIRRGLPT